MIVASILLSPPPRGSSPSPVLVFHVTRHGHDHRVDQLTLQAPSSASILVLPRLFSRLNRDFVSASIPQEPLREDALQLPDSGVDVAPSLPASPVVSSPQ